jgi:hypothetical protein
LCLPEREELMVGDGVLFAVGLGRLTGDRVRWLLTVPSCTKFEDLNGGEFDHYMSLKVPGEYRSGRC